MGDGEDTNGARDFMKKPWHKKWTPFGLLGLEAIRAQMRKENLYDTEQLPKTPGAEAERLEPIDPQRDVRTADGSYTDAQDPNMARAHGPQRAARPLLPGRARQAHDAEPAHGQPQAAHAR